MSDFYKKKKKKKNPPKIHYRLHAFFLIFNLYSWGFLFLHCVFVQVKFSHSEGPLLFWIMHPNITSWVCVIQKRFSKSGTPEKKFNPHFTIIPSKHKKIVEVYSTFSQNYGLFLIFMIFAYLKKKKEILVY